MPLSLELEATEVEKSKTGEEDLAVVFSPNKSTVISESMVEDYGFSYRPSAGEEDEEEVGGSISDAVKISKIISVLESVETLCVDEVETVNKSKTQCDIQKSQESLKKDLNFFGDVDGSIKKSITNKRVWDKKDICIFCEDAVTNFTRHISRKHPKELEVAKYLSLQKGSVERKNLAEQIRKRGNFFYNVSGVPLIKPVRRPNQSSQTSIAKDYLPCKHCYGHFKKQYLRRHVKICKLRKDELSGKRRNVQSEAQSLLLTFTSEDTKLVKEVFPRMQPDDVSTVVKSDPLNGAFGTRYLKCHKDNTDNVPRLVQSMCREEVQSSQLPNTSQRKSRKQKIVNDRKLTLLQVSPKQNSNIKKQQTKTKGLCEKEKKERKFVRGLWTDEQKAITTRYFQKHILLKQAPKKAECEELISKNKRMKEMEVIHATKLLSTYNSTETTANYESQETFDDKKNFIGFPIKATGNHLFNCRDCKFSSSMKRDLILHTRNHNKFKARAREKPYSCVLCNYKCFDRSTLTVHIRTHTGEKPFKCNKCNFRCTTKSYIVIHNRTHDVEKRPFKCLICNQQYTLERALSRHMLVHTGEKLFACYVCSYKCATKANLNVHIRKHTGERPFKCDTCNYTFTSKSNLATHKRTHSVEKKPFKCLTCSRQFTTERALTRHVAAVHTGEKLYACDICDYKLATPQNLMTHIRIHTGEKPYVCHICGCKFAQNSTLTSHIRRHTGEKLFKCDICNCELTSRTSLSAHNRIHEAEKTNK